MEKTQIDSIPKSSIAYAIFGFLLILFSFITWFGRDWLRFFLGLIGGSLVGFIAYIVWMITDTKNEISDFQKDVQAIDHKLNLLENKLIEIKNGRD